MSESESPNFVTVMDDDENLFLYVRSEDDRDYFLWGPITESQRVMLEVNGVFGLTFDAALGGNDEAL